MLKIGINIEHEIFLKQFELNLCFTIILLNFLYIILSS